MSPCPLHSTAAAQEGREDKANRLQSDQCWEPRSPQVSAAQVTPSTHCSSHQWPQVTPASTAQGGYTRDASREGWQEWELRGNVMSKTCCDISHGAPRGMHCLSAPHISYTCACFYLLQPQLSWGERLKPTQPLLLAPEKAPSELTIHIMLEEQLCFSALIHSL